MTSNSDPGGSRPVSPEGADPPATSAVTCPPLDGTPPGSHPDVITGPLLTPVGDPLPAIIGLNGLTALMAEIARKGDVESLSRLMDLEDRWRKREAELAFNAAKGRILAALAEIKIVKNKWVRYEDKKRPGEMIDAFKYAPLEEIDRVLSPLLAREQMDLSYSDEPMPEGRVLIRGRLKHLPGGHYEDSTMPGPLDTSGGKSNIQAVGSTNSFLRRYIACNLFNLVVVGDDDDGTGGPITEEQAKELLALMTTVGAGPKFLSYMKLPTVEASGSPANSVAVMPSKDYLKAKNALEDLRTKRRPETR